MVALSLTTCVTSYFKLAGGQSVQFDPITSGSGRSRALLRSLCLRYVYVARRDLLAHYCVRVEASTAAMLCVE